MSLLAEEFCPVAENLLGRLYRSSPEGVAVLIKSVPPQTRALLAVYCYRRAHLQSIGLTIAGTCEDADLEWVAGRMGRELAIQAKGQSLELAAGAPTKSKKGITLASGHLWDPAPLED